MPTTTTTSARDPWAPIQPYLTGEGGKPGILPWAAENFANGQWTPNQQDWANAYGQNLGLAQENNQQMIGNGVGLLQNGLPSVSNAPTAQATLFDRGSKGTVQADAAAGTAGQAGPIQRDDNINALLKGDYNNPYLDQMYGQASRRMGQAFNENVLPGIGQQAQAAGQYGGSRQGIAEGIAARGQSDALGDLANNMYGNAYNQGFGARTQLTGQLTGLDAANQQFNAGQQTQASLANAGMQTQANMANAAATNQNRQFNASRGDQMSQFNTGQMNAGNQFNANLGLQNNTQRLNQMTTGAGLLTGGQDANANVFQNGMSVLSAPSQYNNQALGNYSNIVNQAGGQGGTSTQQNPYFQNKAATNLGLAAGAVGLGKTIYDWLP